MAIGELATGALTAGRDGTVWHPLPARGRADAPEAPALREQMVASVVRAAGGAVASRRRLQKFIYLIDRLGFGSGMSFDYPGFGPFSIELDNAIDDAIAFGQVEERFLRDIDEDARYGVITLKPGAGNDFRGGLAPGDLADILAALAAAGPIVLDLAAAIDWCWRYDQEGDWRGLMARRRRSVRSAGGRMEKAVALLEQIGLPPPPCPDQADGRAPSLGPAR